MPGGASSWSSISWTTASWRGPATARPRASPSPLDPSRTSTTITSACLRGGGAGPAACARRLGAQAARVLQRFRGLFLGKSSPSHFWWGGFDLACTRFSGRPAPRHPGGIPHLADFVTREAFSHECISAGWWPGSVAGPVTEPAFYAYAYPEPAGCPDAPVRPAATGYHMGMREWILPYEAVRGARDPDGALLEFLQSTYEAAADRGGWDRARLERA